MCSDMLCISSSRQHNLHTWTRIITEQAKAFATIDETQWDKSQSQLVVFFGIKFNDKSTTGSDWIQVASVSPPSYPVSDSNSLAL